MATEIKLPRLGQGMESGTIVKWLKSEGEKVEKGEPLYELDTDKVTQEVEADASGVLLKIAVQEGEVEVGKTIAVIGEQGEEATVSENGAQAPEPPAEAKTDTVRGQTPAMPRTDGGDRIKASPLARRIARERGVDLAQPQGTGPDGRVVAEDVERAGTAPAPAKPRDQVPGQVEIRQLSKVRKTIARRLTLAWEAPVFQLVVSAEQGLVVPVIRATERLSVAEIARTRAEVVQRARDNKLRQDDLEGGTFTISNLGMFGIEQFIAVLNPPQVAILAVGASEERVVVKDGEFVALPTMTMTLTCDHRAIDGAVGADFLRTLKQLVETPALAL